MGDALRWSCKDCVGHDKKPFINHAVRTHCHLCKVLKKKCFKKHEAAPAKPSTPPPPVDRGWSLAQGKKDARLAKVEAELLKLRASNKALTAKQAGAAADPSEAMDVEGDEAEEGYTLDELFIQKNFFKTSGKRGEEDFQRVSALILAKQGEQLAKKPVHVQIKQAENLARKAKTVDAANEEKALALQAKWLAVQSEVTEHADVLAQGKKDLKEADAAYEVVVKTLSVAPSPAAVQPIETTGFAAIAATLPDSWFSAAGFPRETITSILAGLAAGHAQLLQEQQAKDAEEVVRKSAAASAALAEAG
jgi:hypothetical protein